MSIQSDVVPVPASPAIPPVEAVLVDAFAEEIVSFSAAREINERRARIENPELLRRLRGL
ncbi:hypothetical protein [Phenylobacterium sp.]|jgi:hypothetical protein|uniref:hypothetical protein n=1 Tax=Phenylobacterium sp. TaxID=1871053 RepID=UPI002F942401